MVVALKLAEASSPAPAGREGSRTFKIVKPPAGEALVVPIDANARIDVSEITREPITLVHAGDRLIIVFDNQATVTIEPAFDTGGNIFPGLSFLVSPDTELSGPDFASRFPITTDQSVLPAASGGPSSGAYFSDPHVDPLLAGGAAQDLAGHDEGGPSGASAGVLIVVENFNRPPIATDDAFETTEGAILAASGAARLLVGNVISHLPADSDPNGDPLTVFAVSAPTIAGLEDVSVIPAAASAGEVARFQIMTDFGVALLAAETDGDVLLWTAAGNPFAELNPGETATIHFNYSVTDGRGGAASADVDIGIGGVNEVPGGGDFGGAGFGVVMPLASLAFSFIDGDGTLYTASSHPFEPAATYTGGNGDTDTIFLLFTSGQLQEILTTNTAEHPWRDELQIYLAHPAGDVLALGESTWNASAQGFETAHLGIVNPGATTFADIYSEIDAAWKAELTSAAIIGDGGPGDDLVIAAGPGTVSGGEGNDVLVALDAGNTLDGGKGFDLLLGGDGSDVLIGNAGYDLLTGGLGADIFRWGEAGAAVAPGSANADAVIDYNFLEGDKIDISVLLAANFGPASDPAKFVSVQSNGGAVDVFVDPTGSGAFGAADAQVYHLIGVNTPSASDHINIVFSGQQHVYSV
jgi:Ca2+-binding RTX toxin-like protein